MRLPPLLWLVLQLSTHTLLTAARTDSFTIDDTNGDQNGGRIEYFPVAGGPGGGDWNLGHDCPGCSTKLDAGLARQGTWHDAQVTDRKPLLRVTIIFAGTAIKAFGVLKRNDLTQLKFTLDGSSAGSYSKRGGDGDTYNEQYFSATGLEQKEHTLVMESTELTSLVLFDYATYDVFTPDPEPAEPAPQPQPEPEPPKDTVTITAQPPKDTSTPPQDNDDPIVSNSSTDSPTLKPDTGGNTQVGGSSGGSSSIQTSTSASRTGSAVSSNETGSPGNGDKEDGPDSPSYIASPTVYITGSNGEIVPVPQPTDGSSVNPAINATDAVGAPKSNLALILGSAFGAIALVVMLGICAYTVRRRRKIAAAKLLPEPYASQGKFRKMEQAPSGSVLVVGGGMGGATTTLSRNATQNTNTSRMSMSEADTRSLHAIDTSMRARRGSSDDPYNGAPVPTVSPQSETPVLSSHGTQSTELRAEISQLRKTVAQMQTYPAEKRGAGKSGKGGRSPVAAPHASASVERNASVSSRADTFVAAPSIGGGGGTTAISHGRSNSTITRRGQPQQQLLDPSIQREIDTLREEVQRLRARHSLSAPAVTPEMAAAGSTDVLAMIASLRAEMDQMKGLQEPPGAELPDYYASTTDVLVQRLPMQAGGSGSRS